MTKKSNLQPKPFTISSNSIITKITDLQSVIEFLKERKLHFAPLSVYKDHTEGKKFTDLKYQDAQKNHDVPSPFRRKIMYASCWYNGDETLHMWDIYGKNNNSFAIQLDLNQFLQIGFYSKCFRFNSESLNEYASRLKTNHEFKPSSLYY